MATSPQPDIFTTKVVPIMDRVRDELNRRKAEEAARHNASYRMLMAGAAGPDGGMAAMDCYRSQVNYTGKWNTKTVEDYIRMVKAELQRQHITVDAVMEKKMVDRLIHEHIPKSAAEYISRKALEGTLFHIPNRSRESAMQDHINKEAEKKYSPSFLEMASSAIGSWLINAATTLGVGGLIGQAAIDGSVEAVDRVGSGQQKDYLEKQRKLGRQEVAAANRKKASVPGWMHSQMGFSETAYATDRKLAIALKWATDNAKIYRSKVSKALDAGERTIKASGRNTLLSVSDATARAMEYEAFAKAIRAEQGYRRSGKDAVSYQNIAEAEENVPIQKNTVQTTEAASQASAQQPTATGDYSGWNALLGNIGLDGMGDTFNHLGFTLAMLPDMLLGVLTGKTKSVGLNQQTMVPLASLLAGTFASNPMMKIPLMLYGGASLFNVAGQEALAEQRKNQSCAKRYKRYDDEPLDKRLNNPQIEGNVLLVDIDRVPRIVTLPPRVVDAFQTGALPLNTLANCILAKVDETAVGNRRSMDRAADSYEQNQERSQTRGIR